MVNSLEYSERDLLAVEIKGKITEEDYKTLNPLIENKIEQYGKVRMMFELVDVDKMDMDAMWEELKFDADHFSDIEKIAVVGEETWENALTKINKALTTGEVKFFNRSEREKALSWL